MILGTNFAFPFPQFDTACMRSYKRCPFPEGNINCLGSGSWKAESGRTFDYLATAVFYVRDGSSPSTLNVFDLAKPPHKCARAFYKDQFQDFELGDFPLDVSGLWDPNDPNPVPVHITIVPFNFLGSGSCDKANNIQFQTERSLAVWLSPDEGQSSNPGDDSVYCDVSLVGVLF